MGNKDDLIIGIEINRKYCNIGYYDYYNGITCIDTSGGYGKSSFPSSILYAKSSNEWIFGENAINSDIYEDTIIFESILDIVSSGNFINIDGDIISVEFIVKEFFQELLENLFNINPNGVLKKVVIYYEKLNQINCEKVFIKGIGVSSDKITFVTLDHIIINSIKAIEEDSKQWEMFFLGDEESFCATENTCNTYKNLGSNVVDTDIYEYLMNFYKSKFEGEEITGQTRWKIQNIVYHNKELMFNKYLNKQSCKIYFNFCYPALECKISYENLSKIFYNFPSGKNIFKGKNIYIVEKDFITKNMFKEFQYKSISIIKSIIHISRYGLAEEYKSFRLGNKEIVTEDIGILIFNHGIQKFYPILKKGVELPLKKISYDFYVTDNDKNINIVKRGNKTLKTIGSVNIDIIKRFSRIELSMNFINKDIIKVQVVDKGLGNIMESSCYNYSMELNIDEAL